MKINFEKKEIYYRILIFLPSPIIFAKRSNPSSLHQPLISRGEYTVANKAARLSVHVTCPRGARTSSAVFRRSAASLSRLLRVITRPLREAFLRLPGGKFFPKTGSNSINAARVSCFGERTSSSAFENRRQRFRILPRDRSLETR